MFFAVINYLRHLVVKKQVVFMLLDCKMIIVSTSSLTFRLTIYLLAYATTNIQTISNSHA